MYCVRCGVRLQEGVTACPLCGTPVWCPEAGERGPAATYSDRYPVLSRQKRLTVMASLTVGLLSAMVACCSIAVLLRSPVSLSRSAIDFNSCS